MKINTNDWYKKINEALDDPTTNPSTNPGLGSMGGGPGGFGAGQPPQPQDPNITNPAPAETPNAGNVQPPDVSNDPATPDMPEEKEEMDFEQWKNTYFKESTKGDVNKLIDLIHQVRDLDLESYPRRFVENNLQICFLRQNANIDKASKEIRRLVKQELDQNNPSVSLVNHSFTSLQHMPELNNIFIKLKGMYGINGDLHRKYIASLIGGVQVGSGANTEDVIYNEKDYSIRISTRFNDKWGRVDLGKWALKENDAEHYLSDPELKKLEGDGSPGEKEELRKRVIIESISEQFKQRAFYINVVSKNGTVYTLGWDISGSVKSAYTEGKLVVHMAKSDNSEAMIDQDGKITTFVDVKIKYVKETGTQDEDGNPEKEEHDFIERIDGMLFLVARFPIIKLASSSFQGISLKETPYTGNPSDLVNLYRCHFSSVECLMRNC